jgi:hypothetical protein
MTTITIRQEGADKIRLGLNQYATTLQDVTRERIYEAIHKAAEKSPAYVGGNAYNVPLPPSGVDVRTGNLGRSVEYELVGFSAKLHINAYSEKGFKYSTLVLGDANGEGQGKYFQHWPKVKDAVQEEFDRLTVGGELAKQLQDEADKLGF